MIDPKLLEEAKKRIQDRSPRGFGVEPSEDELLSEVNSIQQESKDKLEDDRQDNEEAVDQRAEELKKSKSLFGDRISPELKNYAYNIFPNLSEIAPKEKETDITGMPRVSVEKNVLPENYNELAQQEANEQGTISAPQKKVLRESVAKGKSQEITKSEQPLPKKASDIEKMLKKSEEDEDRVAMLKQGAKLRDAVMGFGLGAELKTDTSMYEDLEKRAQRPMRNLLLKQELEDKQTKSDPNSELSKLARESLGKLGMDMSGFQNVSFSQLEKLYPSLTQALYTKIVADSRKDAAEQARLDRQMIRDAATQAKKEKAATLSDRQINPITEAETAIANLDAVLNLAKDEYVGPIDARIPDILSSADAMAFRSASGRMTDAYRKLITGAGASAFELQKLEANLPKPTDTVAQFKAKAKVFREELNRGRQIYIRNLKKQGKNVSEFEIPEQQELTPEEQLKLIGEQLAAGDARIQELKNKKGK